MNSLNVLFGIVTIFALGFSIYQYWETRAKSKMEEAKVKTLIERIRHLKFGALSSAETANLIVQRSKKPNSNENELGNLARVARGQLILIIKELETEEERLSNWKYGQFESNDIQENQQADQAQDELK